ncbi:hypothetical protein [Paraglaciecola aestuariivivens]
MLKLQLMISVFCCLNFYQASAQESKSQGNFLNAQLSEQLVNQTKVLSEPQLVKAQAELFRQYYLALIETGFDKDQALQIVVALASRDKS